MKARDSDVVEIATSIRLQVSPGGVVAFEGIVKRNDQPANINDRRDGTGRAGVGLRQLRLFVFHHFGDIVHNGLGNLRGKMRVP